MHFILKVVKDDRANYFGTRFVFHFFAIYFPTPFGNLQKFVNSLFLKLFMTGMSEELKRRKSSHGFTHEPKKRYSFHVEKKDISKFKKEMEMDEHEIPLAELCEKLNTSEVNVSYNCPEFKNYEFQY